MFENDLIDKPMFLFGNNRELRIFCEINTYKNQIEPLIGKIDKSQKTIKISMEVIKIQNQTYFCNQILDKAINKKSIIKK